MMTRCPQLGLDFRAWQKIWRLIGVDHLHVNGLGNKFWESDDSVVASVKTLMLPLHVELREALETFGPSYSRENRRQR